MSLVKIPFISIYYVSIYVLLNLSLSAGAATLDEQICSNEKIQKLDLTSAEPQLLLREPLYGVTVDSVDHLNYIVRSLRSLPRMPTTRIVFDEFVPAKNYKKAVNEISRASYVMGEILDSSAMSQYSWQEYRDRVIEYLEVLGPKVHIWEIGNEVNGEWLGDPSHVVKKVQTAYDLVKSYKGKTALTLYYNENCWMYPWEEMFQWAESKIPSYMKQGLDYVLVSYYESDCNNLKPDWKNVFDRLGQVFPNSKLGFGEVGTAIKSQKADYLRRYYTLPINHPRYIGGHFWWYFKQDMVPKKKPLWSVLKEVME
ncbi:hypothetical protein [Nitrosococcus watsonii]|uniref:Putative transmembrane protein n=1 Tax=Nitrosococcus watsoni (strain C-113) TaxID=105559 RepID=D8KBD5_NITWC|nr:hypothetical protein [Nitrosococcus watsonii]ADJ29582.1 putative transmembrane protein [Nitrosococcus watsonii C-113]